MTRTPTILFSVCFFCLISLARAEAPPQDVRIVFIGDSITAGYGVLKEESFPERLEQLLGKRESEKNIHLVVTNAGISGSLSSSAVSRVRYYMKLKPQIIVLELGGNDGLKGTDSAYVRKNLSEAIDLARASKIKVLLIGMQIYSNFGDTYTRSFAKIYSDIAQEKKVELMPFLLEGVALDKNLHRDGQPVYVSLEQGFSERWGIHLGDKLSFDVAGVPIEAIVRNLRVVRWSDFNPNFYFEFQGGILDDAPKTWLADLQLGDSDETSRFENILI